MAEMLAQTALPSRAHETPLAPVLDGAERERLLLAEWTSRAAAEQARVELAQQAAHDSLTGLLNLRGLEREVGAFLASWPTAELTVLSIDLDRFRLIIDSLGHATGDRLLVVFGQRLAALGGPTDLVARMGGDEFVVVMFDVQAAEAERMAEAVLAAGRAPVEDEVSLLVTASVGLAAAGECAGLGTLLREADAAMYRAKDAGRDQVVWFDEQMHAESVRRVQTEHDLRQALQGDELFLEFQPAFDLRCERVTHIEALVRWRHPARGLVPPADFIPVAEESGLIHQLGEWVLARAVEQAARWEHVPGLRVWINISPRQLAHGGLPELVAAHLNRVGLTADRFGIELTESTFADWSRMTQALQDIRELGVAVAIDDFGTGYSSLARLTRLPVDVIKIDRSFVAGLEEASGEAVLAGIVTIAHAISAHVIAEGVETRRQLATLSALGVDSASGYLLARPAPPEHMPLPRAAGFSLPARGGLHPTLENLIRKLSSDGSAPRTAVPVAEGADVLPHIVNG